MTILNYQRNGAKSDLLNNDKAPKHIPKSVTPTEDYGHCMVVRSRYYYTLLNHGQNITAEVYCQELEEMHRNLHEKMPALINRRGPTLLHDNARPYVAQMTLQQLNKMGCETLPILLISLTCRPPVPTFLKHLVNFLQGKIQEQNISRKWL
ncbi:histone-lysine N-methyltransferase SETMAR-like [Tachypleus tridentatus]|uniref:histone-lysine N-methyltransferase SETMAR-like n=1 Tax=Tachypleus tridentatus TaxID=6853 RepID=UPI003FD16889